MLRVVLLNSDTHSRMIKDELDFIVTCLKMENLRFSDKFHNDIHLTNEKINHRHIPNFMIQTFIENSIRHGLVHKKENCYLEVRIEDMGDSTKIFIKDNGIGRKAAAELSRESTCKGISILQDFIEAHNKIQDKEFLMEIINLFADEGVACGTLVRLEVPVSYK